MHGLFHSYKQNVELLTTRRPITQTINLMFDFHGPVNNLRKTLNFNQAGLWFLTTPQRLGRWLIC